VALARVLDKFLGAPLFFRPAFESGANKKGGHRTKERLTSRAEQDALQDYSKMRSLKKKPNSKIRKKKPRIVP
jgi:hypothetical protein